MSRMISGIKPTGKLTLGNYLGAVKRFVEYQNSNELFVFIADLHALTTATSGENSIRGDSEDILAVYLAAGLDPKKCVIFRQSDVLGHVELAWLLTCNTALGEFTKMPQYKNYLEKRKEGNSTGILMYPALMAADILMYDAECVPVGLDQKPHVDLCRDIAEKLNRRYGDIFVLPKAVVPKVGAKIMSLTDPTKKMSKSESDAGTIYVLDDIAESKRKIMKATTDSENKIYYDPKAKPGVSNLIAIYSCLSGLNAEEIAAKYEGVPNYGVFKRDLCDLLELELARLQSEVARIKASGEIPKILKDGARICNLISTRKLNQVYEAVGLRARN